MSPVQMEPNRTKQLLRAGQAAFGPTMGSSSTLMAEVLGRQGPDFVVIDLQHSESNINDVQRLVSALLPTPATPIVRVPGNDSIMIQRCLDLGAYGVIVPYVNSVEEARAAVAATRYPPLGQRSWGLVRGAYYMGSDYFQRANEEILLVVMLETKQAADNAEAIMAVEGVDGSIIGPNDLAVSYGYPSGLPQLPPDVEQGAQRIVAAAQSTGKFTGMFLQSWRHAQPRVQEGFRFLTVGNDVRMAAMALQSILSEVRK